MNFVELLLPENHCNTVVQLSNTKVVENYMIQRYFHSAIPFPLVQRIFSLEEDHSSVPWEKKKGKIVQLSLIETKSNLSNCRTSFSSSKIFPDPRRKEKSLADFPTFQEPPKLTRFFSLFSSRVSPAKFQSCRPQNRPVRREIEPTQSWDGNARWLSRSSSVWRTTAEGKVHRQGAHPVERDAWRRARASSRDTRGGREAEARVRHS